MNEQAALDYRRIAEAIAYIQQNHVSQPTLEEIAEKVNLSPFHFQRLFTRWAGVSPKKFLQYSTVQYAKCILSGGEASLFEAAHASGLSGTGRLHDLFVNIEGMTPGEFKKKGEQLDVLYAYALTLFGEVLIASTLKGICYIGFADDRRSAYEDLVSRFQNASFSEGSTAMHAEVLKVFGSDWTDLSKVKLHLKGTDFQLKVWEALLKIPSGAMSTYGGLAKSIDCPKASRAVGTAIGSNPIAFLIPCHRVIQSTGLVGGYMWGSDRKRVLLSWEAAQLEINKVNNHGFI